VPGARIEVRGALGTALSPTNHGVRGLEDYLRARGIFTEIRVRRDSVRELAPAKFSLALAAYRMRAWQAEAFRRAAPADVLPLVYTVWLGERNNLDYDVRDAFVLSGTAHILAVSGIHCAIVFYAVAAALRLFVRGPKRRGLLTMLAVLAFALIAGARVSTLRAAAMFSLYVAADCFGRERDAPTALGVSALLFLGLQPSLLFDAGFLLSFGSVASLLLFAKPISESLPATPRFLFEPLSAALAVQVLPLPLAIRFFNILPWTAPLLNVPVVALLGVVLWLCFATAVCALVVPFAAPLFGHALAPVVRLVIWLAEMSAAQPASYFRLPSPSPLAMICYWTSAAMLAAALHRRIRGKHAALAIVALLLASAAVWRPWNPPPSIDWVDVGHGDAIFIRAEDGATALVDGGNRSDYGDAGARHVLPFLLAQGVTHLDYVIATHPDRDHLGGLLTVVDTISVSEAVLGPPQQEQPLEAEFLALCQVRGIPVQRVAAGNQIVVGNLQIDVLNPPHDVEGWEDNDRSLVLHLDFPPIRVLLPGDIERRGEQHVASRASNAFVAMAPHHGSATSSSAAYLEAVAPAHIVVSTGQVGQRRSVAASVLERYAALGIRVWRTDQYGGLRLRVRDGRVVLESARRARGYDLVPTPNSP
jgi:competence protein ComEC